MIKINNLTHTYGNRKEEALKSISLEIKKGENVVVIGSSGSGKSTLLKSINRLIEPSSGEIYINGKEILRSSQKEAVKIRGDIGMIFQNFNLIERDTVLKNVLNGRLRKTGTFKTIIGKFSKEDYEIAKKNIQTVGLAKFENEKVSNLSGGQKQRVAIARTLSQEPNTILADEPVSSLDPRLMTEILDLLKDICKRKEITLITSLHFLDLAREYGSRIVGLKDGEIVFDGAPDDLSEKEVLSIYGETGF